MRIMNNVSSVAALDEIKKNDKAFSKAMKILASGMKLNSAGDGAAEYSISENMRVRIRCLSQDSENVRQGKSLLQVAEGAVQSQINLLRTIKERVINANNDTNTDSDRQIIQKEINQYYNEIDDIANMTNFNGKLLLAGGKKVEAISSWVVLDSPVEIEGSQIGGDWIRNASSQTLDGITDVFALYDEWKLSSSTVNMSASGGPTVASTNAMTGGGGGTAKKVSFDFAANYANSTINSLYGTGLQIGYTRYVLTNDTSKTYNSDGYSYEKIDINGCTTLAQVVSKIASATSSNSYAKVTADGTTLKAEAKSSSSNSSCQITTWSSTVTAGASVSASGNVSGTQYLKGGTNSTGLGNADSPIVPGTKASYTTNVGAANTGMTLYTYADYYLKFVSGSGGKKNETISGKTVATVGTDYTGSFSLGSTTVTMSGGKITFTANSDGTSGNNFYVKDGITISGSGSKEAVGKIKGTQNIDVAGSTGNAASYTLDLSAYDTTDADKLEKFIEAWKGKALKHSYGNCYYEFIDGKDSTSLDKVAKIDNISALNQRSRTLDLNTLRTNVSAGKTIAEAFANLVTSNNGSGLVYNSYGLNASKVMTDSKVTGIKFSASSAGATGNTITVHSAQLRSYTIDFKTWLDNADLEGKSIADYLNEKGFKAYCATDSAQWFNFIFSNGKKDPDKPESGGAGMDIKSIHIELGDDITDVESLINTFYTQADAALKKINHFMNVAKDNEKGTITLYDSRAHNINNKTYYPDKQEKGAKIADGILDNVVKDWRYLYEEEVVIHHTDHSSDNITVHLPRTTMDQIFGYKKENYEPEYFNVLTKEMRERLLGWDSPGEKGIIDKGIDYLLDAQTLIGSQIKRMEFTDENITAAAESTTAAESTIRDSDMAKEYCEFSKASILMQTAQAMLGQSNQNAGRAVELLQGT